MFKCRKIIKHLDTSISTDKSKTTQPSVSQDLEKEISPESVKFNTVYRTSDVVENKKYQEV